jgi:hypothetical protein
MGEAGKPPGNAIAGPEVSLIARLLLFGNGTNGKQTPARRGVDSKAHFVQLLAHGA